MVGKGRALASMTSGTHLLFTAYGTWFYRVKISAYLHTAKKLVR